VGHDGGGIAGGRQGKPGRASPWRTGVYSARNYLKINRRDAPFPDWLLDVTMIGAMRSVVQIHSPRLWPTHHPASWRSPSSFSTMRRSPWAPASACAARLRAPPRAAGASAARYSAMAASADRGSRTPTGRWSGAVGGSRGAPCATPWSSASRVRSPPCPRPRATSPPGARNQHPPIGGQEDVTLPATLSVGAAHG
jgi:hypothetical protein